jgi:hypothetical protein
MRLTRLMTLLLCLTPFVSAQTNDSWNPEWDQFRLTEYDQEVIDGIKEFQSLIRGRESIIQSYETTDQKAIATERAIQGLYQDHIGTQRARMAYAEQMLNLPYSRRVGRA